MARDKQSPACGEAPEHLSPLLLGDELCPWAIASAIRAEETTVPRSSENWMAGREFRIGSLYFDLALSQGADCKVSETHMATAATYLEKAAQRDSPAALNALFLKAGIPFIRRRRVSHLDGQEILSLQDNLLEAIDRVPEAQKNMGNVVGGIHLLYARQGRVAMAATAREMTYTPGTRRPADHPWYHDLYVINVIDGKKIPHRLQSYTHETDLKRVLYVNLGRIAKLAIEDVTYESLNSASAKNQAFDWLYDEAAGHRPDTTTRRILDQMETRLRTERGSFLRRSQDM